MDIFNHVLRLKGFPLHSAARELKRIQAMGIDEFIDWQENKAWEMVRYHYEHNDFYRQKVGSRIPENWEDLPIITKKDLQRPLADMLTSGTKLSDCHVGSTSGSSGTPFYFAKDKFSHAMTWAVVDDRYGLYNIRFSSRQARFYGIPKEFVAYWKERIKDSVMNRFRFPVFDLSDGTMEKFLNTFRRSQFDYLYGYTNSMVIFARFLIKNRVMLKNECPSLTLCISTSEVCTPEDHRILEQGFGVRHIQEYGASETCLMAFDTPDDGWRITEETIFNEVVDEEAHAVPCGVSGNVLCTSLFNKALPMIRYQIGDMAIFNDRKKGSKYRSIHKLVGRTNDTAILPSGKVAAGLTFYYISRSILESTGALKEFIIRQVALDHFVFEIVADRDLEIAETEEIKNKISTYLEANLTVTINRVDKINRPASGKLKHFYSELDKL